MSLKAHMKAGGASGMRHFLVISAVILICAAALFSCARGGDLFAYRAENCAFDLVFTADTGDGGVRGAVKKRGESFALTLIREGTANVVFTYNGENVYLCVGELRIALSADASETLRYTLDTLFARGEEAAAVRRSEDGEFTVITGKMGEVTLDKTLTPVAVTVFSRGTERKIAIENYTCTAGEQK